MNRKKAAAPVERAREELSAGQKPERLTRVESGAAVTAPERTWGETAALWLFSVLLFFAMTLQSGWASVGLTGLALVLSVGKTSMRNLRAHLSVPVAGLCAFALLCGFAALYSAFGDYAASEYGKLLASFSLAVLVLARFHRGQVRGLLWGFAAVCGVISLVCVDMAVDGALFQGFVALMGNLGVDYSTLATGDAWGTRVNGIFNDANLTASLFALGGFSGLYLVQSSQKTREKALACCLLGLSSTGFLLAMSRAAILCFLAATLVYLIATAKERRLELLLLLLETLLVTAVCAAAAMETMTVGALAPGLLTLLCGGLIFLLDGCVGARLATRLVGHGKALVFALVAATVLAGGYGVAALNVTGPYTLAEGEILTRSVALAPGDYTVTGQWNGDLNANIYVQTEFDALKAAYTNLYFGPLADASFRMPEEVSRVYVQFTGAAGDTLESVALSDGTQVKLDYRLLPKFAANRLQDSLRTSTSTLLRAQYVRDGWSLFTKSPLIGHGLGATEGLLTSVQPFFYESLYLHNHLLQVMNETGLLGLAAFLAMMLGTAWLLLRRLREERDPLAVMLLACLVMMNLHGLMELTFSVRMYQCAAFFLLAVTSLLYARPAKREKAQRRGGWALACVIWLYLAAFGGLYASHLQVQHQARTQGVENAAEFMDANASFVRRDVFDHEQFQLNYVGNAVLLDSSLYNGIARKYAEELRRSGTYTACSGLTRYYYLPKGQIQELFAVSREGIAQEASSQDAWNLQFDFYRQIVLPEMEPDQMDAFISGVLETAGYLTQYSSGRMEEIVLTEENRTFLADVKTAQALPADEARALLMETAHGTAAS